MCTVYANVLMGVLFSSTNRCLNSEEFSGGECNSVRVLFSFIVNSYKFSSG